MKKNLGKILATSAVAGLALFGSAGKANANPIISYENSIQQIDMNGNGFNQPGDVDDYYRVGLRVENLSNHGTPIADTCFQLEYNTDLAPRGAFNFQDMYSAWNFDANGEGKDYWQFGENVLPPGTDNTVYYDVLAKDVIGWDTAQVRLLANSGWSNTFAATVPIPEPMTTGLLASGTAVLLAGRRLKENAKRR